MGGVGAPGPVLRADPSPGRRPAERPEEQPARQSGIYWQVGVVEPEGKTCQGAGLR